jgi:peptidoglycan/xylan/chitin deacetylase (PgdA/CDA1 family)
MLNLPQKLRKTFEREKKVRMRNQRAIVSFTFDDFPHSAATVGAHILNRHGLRGTFYLAGSFCGRSVDGVEQYSSADLAAVVAQGHEVGCHTFNHRRVSTLSDKETATQIDLNSAFIAGRFPNLAMRTFAYPYGDVPASAPDRLRRAFAACRSSDPGINEVGVDPARLRSMRLYQNRISTDTASEMIRQTIQRNGWLIFYTHDVGDIPSEYGCTPALLEFAVAAAAASGAAVLPVCEAIAETAGRHLNSTQSAPPPA